MNTEEKFNKFTELFGITELIKTRSNGLEHNYNYPDLIFGGAFDWGHTKEGMMFWSFINEEWMYFYFNEDRDQDERTQSVGSITRAFTIVSREFDKLNGYEYDDILSFYIKAYSELIDELSKHLDTPMEKDVLYAASHVGVSFSAGFCRFSMFVQDTADEHYLPRGGVLHVSGRFHEAHSNDYDGTGFLHGDIGFFNLLRTKGLGRAIKSLEVRLEALKSIRSVQALETEDAYKVKRIDFYNTKMDLSVFKGSKALIHLNIFLADNHIQDEFFDNVKNLRQTEYELDNDHHFLDAITSAFRWDQTPEGDYFWREFNDKWRTYYGSKLKHGE